jgi:hypothetical protein
MGYRVLTGFQPGGGGTSGGVSGGLGVGGWSLSEIQRDGGVHGGAVVVAEWGVRAEHFDRGEHAGLPQQIGHLVGEQVDTVSVGRLHEQYRVWHRRRRGPGGGEAPTQPQRAAAQQPTRQGVQYLGGEGGRERWWVSGGGQLR